MGGLGGEAASWSLTYRNGLNNVRHRAVYFFGLQWAKSAYPEIDAIKKE